LQGRNWHDICQQSNTAMLSTTVQRTRQDGRSHQSREQLPGDMGTSRILDVQTFPLHQQHGPNMILHVVDVTERLNLEAMLVQSERRAAMGSLSATIAHEVNTPLQAIQSLLYLAMRGSDQRTIRHLTRASAQIERINAIFKRLLDLHHVGDMSPTRIDINTIIEHLLDLVRVPLDERHIAVQTHLESSLPRLWGNADKLSQAVLNLLLNAIEAMPNGGTLSLHTSSVPAPQQGNIPATIVVAVRDTGSGIPHDMQQRIFAPFFTTRPGGAGIGLAVSNRIVAEHGGTLSVSSAPNEGSTFTLELPATHPSEPGANH
jgi:signal transduction histidine kinase